MIYINKFFLTLSWKLTLFIIKQQDNQKYRNHTGRCAFSWTQCDTAKLRGCRYIPTCRAIGRSFLLRQQFPSCATGTTVYWYHWEETCEKIPDHEWNCIWESHGTCRQKSGILRFSYIDHNLCIREYTVIQNQSVYSFRELPVIIKLECLQFCSADIFY